MRPEVTALDEVFRTRIELDAAQQALARAKKHLAEVVLQRLTEETGVEQHAPCEDDDPLEVMIMDYVVTLEPGNRMPVIAKMPRLGAFQDDRTDLEWLSQNASSCYRTSSGTWTVGVAHQHANGNTMLEAIRAARALVEKGGAE